MSTDMAFGKFLANFINTIKQESVEWQKQNQAELLRLKGEKEIAEKKINEEIRRMEARFQGDLERIKKDEEIKTKSFVEFLESINESKQQFLDRYPKMPKPIALMICHHATELLKEAWDNPDIYERQKKESKYIQFMVTIGEDLAEASEAKMLPEKTIKLIDRV
jgi:hypothetical protein